MTKSLALIAVFSILSGATHAIARSDQERGWAAYARGDYALAAELIRP